MAEGRFWLQVRQWFRTGEHVDVAAPAVPELDADGVLESAHPEGAPGDGYQATTIRPWFRRGARAQTISRLEDRYDQLTGLIDSIHKHLETQETRSGEMATALSELAASVSRLPESTQSQTRQLEAIATHLEAANTRSDRWELVMDRFAEHAESQSEALRDLGEQINATRGTHECIADSLVGFGDAMGNMSKVSSASTQALRDLQTSAASRQEQLGALFNEQGRRFGQLFAIGIVLAAVIAASTAALLVFK
jgi:hypothetical protein